jgi:hypothetical protein
LDDKHFLLSMFCLVTQIFPEPGWKKLTSGELAAWQLEYLVYHAATGKWYDETDAPFNGSKTQ